MALAEVLREQEVAPSSGVRATSPAPSLPGDVTDLPLVSASSPPTPAPPTAPGMTDMASIVQSLYGPGGAQQKTVEALRGKGAAMGPVIDTVTAAINAPRPERPVAPTLTEPPSRGLRPFMSVSETAPPETALQNLITSIGLFAMGLGGGAGAAKASLASLTGAMAGWNAGDKERAERAFADWEAQTQQALKQWQIQNQDFENVLAERNLDLNGRMQQLKLVALKHDNDIAASELEAKGLEGLMGYLTKERDAANDYAIKSATLWATVQNNAATRAHQAATLDETKRHNLQTEEGKAADIAMKGRELDLKAREMSMAKPEEVDRLRDDFVKMAGDFVKVRDAYSRVVASAKQPSAAGDLALIFAYMKILDPNSVVREQEFATAQNAAGVPERVRALWNRALEGERLTDVTRSDFVDRSRRLYIAQQERYEDTERVYRDLAGLRQIDAARVVPDLAGPLRMIRVKRKSDGAPGWLEPGDFNDATYERVK